MTDYSKITALYSRLSVGDEDRDGGESNSIQNQKVFLENYARGQHLTNIRHYIDDDESGRFFDRSAYSRMMDDVENGKIGVCIMKDLTRWGRDYLQVGNAMEIFRRNNVRFIAVNNGIDSEKPDTLEFAPFINIMSEWYAKDISKKVKTGKLTAQALQAALKKYLQHRAKGPKLHHGKQSLKQLKAHGAALTNIEVTEANVGAFKPCAKKYGVDFTLRKDKTTQPPHYIVIFKAKDADNLEQAFREFTAKTLSKEQRPSIRKVLAAAKQKAARQPKRAKEKIKQRGLVR